MVTVMPFQYTTNAASILEYYLSSQQLVLMFMHLASSKKYLGLTMTVIYTAYSYVRVDIFHAVSTITHHVFISHLYFYQNQRQTCCILTVLWSVNN